MGNLSFIFHIFACHYQYFDKNRNDEKEKDIVRNWH